MSSTAIIKAAWSEFITTERKFSWFKLKVFMAWSRFFAKFFSQSAADYMRMQKRQYELAAAVASIRDGKLLSDCVAAVDWEVQNKWDAYQKYIFNRIEDKSSKIALEFGCGPGRNIIAWGKHFKRVDGADISQKNLDNAAQLAKIYLPADKQPKLFLTQGNDAGAAANASYDVAFSVICLQHICVHEIRQKIFESLFRALKPGGKLFIQMGADARDMKSVVDYFDNHYSAGVTNGAVDVNVSDPAALQADLLKAGFSHVETNKCPVPEQISSVFNAFVFAECTKAM